MKGTEQVLLFSMLYAFESLDENNQMRATEQYVLKVSFLVFHKNGCWNCFKF